MVFNRHILRIELWFRTAPLSHVAFALMILVFLGRISLLRDLHPINDGGLFYPVVQTIRTNPGSYPYTFGYNGSDIPFAYPPLGIFLQAFITNQLPYISLELFTLIPFVVTLLCIPLWFTLANLLTHSRLAAFLSTLLVAGIPESFTLTIMGAGITRAWGLLFSLCFFICLSLYSKHRKLLWYASTGVCLGLVILSHPDAAIFAVVTGTVLWFRGNNNLTKTRFMEYGGVALLAAAVAAPWVITVTSLHGWNPFFAAGQTRKITGILSVNSGWMLSPDLPYRWLIIFSAFGIIAILRKKHSYYLLVWLVVSMCVRSTSMITFDIYPLALTASIGMTQLAQGWSSHILRKRYYWFSIIVLIAALPWASSQVIMSVPRLRSGDTASFTWIRTYTPPTASFLVISPQRNWWNENVAEWLPALTGRTSILTIQGMEWLSHGAVNPAIASYQAVRRCSTSTLDCIHAAAKDYKLHFTHIYMVLAKDQPGTGDYCPLLLYTLRNSPQYREMFGNEGALIWERLY